jgi:diacylglycerol kinase
VGKVLLWIGRRQAALSCALKGLAYMWSESHFRVHIVAAVSANALCWGLSVSSVEWALVAIVCGAVLALEACNSAIEQLADVVSPDFQPAIGQLKDIAAAAVLLMSATALIVGCLIFIPKLLPVLFP